MTIERAIEILDPTHKERYDKLETVEKACWIGMNALKRMQSKKVKNQATFNKMYARDMLGICPECGAELEFDAHTKFCGYCGQRVEWNE